MEDVQTLEQINSIHKMIKKGKPTDTDDLVPPIVSTPEQQIEVDDISIVKEKSLPVNTDGFVDSPRKNEIYADVLGRLSTMLGKKGDTIRSRIYSRAQDTVLGMDGDITSPNQLEGKPNIGPVIISKLVEYDETQTLRIFEREKENPEIWLTDIYGIGPKKAQDLVKRGIKTIDDLRNREKELLNETQKVGLKYYEDILQRIPRSEIITYDKLFDEIFQAIDDKDANYEIVGSYRRGAHTSGDIDVIITSKNNDTFDHFIDDLKANNVILEILSRGKTKCLVVAKLPGATYARRVDFMYTTPEEYPFAILYFTGSKSFNTVMRGYALKLGLSLNEHGLYVKEKGKTKGEKVDKKFQNEEEIFTSLFLKYKTPVERIDGRSVETSLPIIPDNGVEKKGQSCYKTCDTVPAGECATGCSPSWTNNKLNSSRNWCTCNLNKTDCIINRCPAHSEPDEDTVHVSIPKKSKPKKTRKVALDEDGNPKPKKTRKVALDEDGNPKPRKNAKKVKLNIIAPKLVLDEEPILDKDHNIETITTDLVPILHANKGDNEPVTTIRIKKNKTVKRIYDNPVDTNKENQKESSKKNIESNEQSDNMDKKIEETIKYVDRLRKEGIDMLDTLTETNLVDWNTAASHSYYNTKTAFMTDNEYDILREFIDRKYPTNVEVNIGANVTKHKVTLPYKMASMDKIKPDTNALISWCQKYKGPYVLSCKLDGVSGMYTTEGDVPKLYTRGNGTIGQDISHLLPVFKLPLEPNIVVRGEFIIPRVIFEEKYKSKFANPRNLVSGIINRKTVDEKTIDVDFVAYEVIKPSLKPSEQMKQLIELGHKVVHHKLDNTLSNEMLSETLLDWRTNHEYEIDGVIVTDDMIHPRADGNPEHSFAFKMIISDQVAEAKVVDVLWEPSKSGYLKPRVRIEPIRLGGVTIEYATGFNGKFIETNKIGIGSVIQIIRSGDVIPYIKSITTPAETAKMPNEEYHWTESRVDVILNNIDDNETVHAKNITDFFTALEVDGLGKGIVNKIMKGGYKTIPAILKMTKDELQTIDGFKPKKINKIPIMVNKIHDGIKDKINKASLVDIMSASNKFGRGIAKQKIQSIMKVYPDILTSDELTQDKKNMLQTIDGIGKENASSFSINIPVFLEFLKECDLMHKLDNTASNIQVEVQPEYDIEHPLYQKHIVMTKVRDKVIIEYLKTNGGILDDAMSKHTDILIVKSLDDVSNKTKKAKDDNIPIMTPEMFKTQFME
jgi:DNA ligase (NAD+)